MIQLEEHEQEIKKKGYRIKITTNLDDKNVKYIIMDKSKE